MGDRIEIVIEGLEENEGKVKLKVFLAELQSFAATLAKLAKSPDDKRDGNLFEVVQLAFSSPYRVGVQAIPNKANPVVIEAIIDRFDSIADALARPDALLYDFDILEDLQKLAKPVGKEIKLVSILYDGKSLDIDRRTADIIETSLTTEDECIGSVEGMLEQINLHHGANTFHIFPRVGPSKLVCKFPNRMYDDAIFAVGRRVEVFGNMRYRAGSDFPHEVGVTGIDIFEPESDLPDWDDLRGRAPNATGDMSSEDFIKELRLGWR